MEKILTFDINFEDIKLDKNRLLSILGYQKEAPSPVIEEIDFVLSEAHKFLDIKAGCRIYTQENATFGKTIEIKGRVFNPKNIIASRLKKSEGIIIFAVTAGQGISDWSKELMNSGEMLKGYIVDAAGSESVESAADILEYNLENILSLQEFKITNRYSPGYCGWNVSEQQLLFSLLPSEFLGITLSSSSLMNPIKSISGFIGMGKNVKKEDYECSICEIDHCIRKRSL